MAFSSTEEHTEEQIKNILTLQANKEPQLHSVFWSVVKKAETLWTQEKVWQWSKYSWAKIEMLFLSRKSHQNHEVVITVNYKSQAGGYMHLNAAEEVQSNLLPYCKW